MEIKNIAVIGAGAAGRAIAFTAVSAGIPTVLEDVTRSTLEDGTMWIERKLEDSVRGDPYPDVTQRNLGLVSLRTANKVEDAIRDADLIIETVPEELEMKLELFTIFDKFAKPGAVFASTTTKLSIADFSDVTVYRDRCVGMRFLEVDSAVYRIELVKTPHTSEETVAACLAVARRMNKEVLLMTDLSRQDPEVWPNAK
ncbi:MAG TPA: 3-hydroxyacyl-CoA dehydrogenase NAD-binding domain-containing protein [Candidatus Saccharimonadales bacterium]|nr:3-hydroxyacyl-CoA dehydrogenase NAD-binding domain-containing protein [Candidatus Saccharimonadales bacterium]